MNRALPLLHLFSRFFLINFRHIQTAAAVAVANGLVTFALMIIKKKHRSREKYIVIVARDNFRINNLATTTTLWAHEIYCAEKLCKRNKVKEFTTTRKER